MVFGAAVFGAVVSGAVVFGAMVFGVVVFGVVGVSGGISDRNRNVELEEKKFASYFTVVPRAY